MECMIVKNYLRENECDCSIVPVEISKHIKDCETCKKQYQFAAILNSHKDEIEKAPQEVLPAIEMKILDSIRQSANEEPFGKFKYLLKPAFAGFFTLLLAIMAYTYLANKNVGYVENLSKRFKIEQFENIKSGDVLYVGDSSIAVIRLKSNSQLQIHQNTTARVKGPRQIELSRGELSLLSGDKEITVQTPDGVLVAKNADIKITTTVSVENGSSKTETSCIVALGKVTIKHASKEIVVDKGQKVVLAENGGTVSLKQLTVAESESEKYVSASQKLFAAVESLCDCIYSAHYTSVKRGNHLELFGKEINESKFKVRVFWQDKTLNALAFGPTIETSKSAKTRRINAS